ncbi:DUF6343 family protein [Streptomyces sp. NBC_01571]|uniref:DUF6343 family protein n=1 Tax=Streptomyces sp. NBC_01571 TaxID=2975883 RepID=UPI00225BB130|nr:DUF6343 family protein [Streptomyces sp. NBC_01571]MCX4578471.1 DUF6343 family protein [Streptomyces sp. NBC_01571]
MCATLPRRRRSGTEPSTARSALKLRFLLALTFTPLFAAATIGFALWASHAHSGDTVGPTTLAVLAALFGLLTAIAAIDLWVVVRRRRTNV